VKLHDLLVYDDIVIQCHNAPDADAIASGFALYSYLKSFGKEPRLIYGGRSVIRKTDLVMLIQDLNIPIKHVEQMDPPELLVLVDCQYQGGNTTVFEAQNVAVIDHHRVCTQLPKL
jgi:phosphoglycolate phosphatase